ncbi:TetR/AcrR family transcriptional regulator [Streptomyces sp. NPDC005921]|uniref:TetR/AcrR family transcriptional regulator n=1 Tax=Streptomyces sp. NPDC005827 TaxID=3157070 RepID=UPI0033E1A5ED
MAGTRTKRGEYAKTAERRHQILSAATEVFGTLGFHKGSLRDVAERTGLTQAGILHHFPGKSDLLNGVLVWRDEQTRERFDEGLNAGGLHTLRTVVDLIQYNQTTPHLVELYTTIAAEATSADHPAHEYFQRRYAWAVRTLEEALEQAAAAGQVTPGLDCPRAARLTTAMMDGLNIQWLLDRTSVDVADDIRQHIQSLLTVEL